MFEFAAYVVLTTIKAIWLFWALLFRQPSALVGYAGF
jgi:hypothetical protein